MRMEEKKEVEERSASAKIILFRTGRSCPQTPQRLYLPNFVARDALHIFNEPQDFVSLLLEHVKSRFVHQVVLTTTINFSINITNPVCLNPKLCKRCDPLGMNTALMHELIGLHRTGKDSNHVILHKVWDYKISRPSRRLKFLDIMLRFTG